MADMPGESQEETECYGRRYKAAAIHLTSPPKMNDSLIVLLSNLPRNARPSRLLQLPNQSFC
jgi:hypothetical protein